MRSAETMDSRPWPPPDRLEEVRVGLEAVARDETGGPQHPQRVVAEGDVGVERGAQPPGGEVGEAVERVDQGQLGQAQGHGVDGEVPAAQVEGDVVAEA